MSGNEIHNQPVKEEQNDQPKEMIVNTEQIESRRRIQSLTQKVYDVIGEEAENGMLSLYEINDSLLSIMHAYNKRFLNQQCGIDVTGGK